MKLVHALISIAALGGALSTLGGCDAISDLRARYLPGDAGGDAADANGDFDVEAVATGEPGEDRRQWWAENQSTRDITGNLTVSLDGGRGGPLVLAFANGLTLKVERVAEKRGADRTGQDNQTFAAALGGDPNAGVYVYQIKQEEIDDSAPNGGLCRQSRTTHVAISEFVNRSGEWAFRVAAFRGAGAPGDSSADAPSVFCSAFAYRLR
jgi:hypothetical protein